MRMFDINESDDDEYGDENVDSISSVTAGKSIEPSTTVCGANKKKVCDWICSMLKHQFHTEKREKSKLHFIVGTYIHAYI